MGIICQEVVGFFLGFSVTVKISTPQEIKANHKIIPAYQKNTIYKLYENPLIPNYQINSVSMK